MKIFFKLKNLVQTDYQMCCCYCTHVTRYHHFIRVGILEGARTEIAPYFFRPSVRIKQRDNH